MPLNRRNYVWDGTVFAESIDNPDNFDHDMFRRLKIEIEKMDQLPENRKENRAKKLIKDVLVGYEMYIHLKQHKEKNQQE